MTKKALFTALTAAAGALVGAAIGAGVAAWAMAAPTASWSDVSALVLAAVLGGQGVIVVTLSFLRKASEQRGGLPPSFLRLQGGVLMLAGFMLALPAVMALAASDSLSQATALLGMVAICTCFLVQTALNWMLWRRSDEFLKRLTAETSVVCFWVLQAALFLWAAGERLSLLPAADAWSALSVLMTVYVAASYYISLRRGAAA